MLSQEYKHCVIAIPSFERYQSIRTKTLSTLSRYGINSNKIYIFVANEFEHDLYEHELLEYKHLYNKIIIGEKGISNQRNFISKYFKEGLYIISCDDDIEDFYIKKDKKYIMCDMNEFFNFAYEQLKENNAYLWGVYPTSNAYWMKENDMSKDLRYCIGGCYGYINRHLDCLYPKSSFSEGKEDYEISILFYKNDDILLRFNNISYKTKVNAIGGLGKFRFQQNKIASDYMCKTYPDLVCPKTRSNGMSEIILKKSPYRKIDFNPKVLNLVLNSK